MSLAAALWLTASLVATAGHAQTRPSTLAGRVTDQQGGALVGATVTARSVSGSIVEVAITDDTGAYRLDALRPGPYAVTLALSGFESHKETVNLQPGAVRMLAATLALSPFAQQVEVVGVSPALGGGVDRARLPAKVSVIGSSDLIERGASSFADALHERMGSVTLEGVTSNPYQPTLRFRGFTASPLLGLPQGIAVYQNGVRINEPFGDTVQFDLIPQFALQSVQLSAGTEPTFGLNALGGAMALRLKDGFEASGFRGEVTAGSFGRVTGTAEYGAHRGPWAVYLGATHFDETGWRTASQSDVTQVVADLAYREKRVDAGVSFTYADTSLNGNGPAPVELLQVDRSAVFTYPDTTENRLAFGQGRFNVSVSPAWSVQLSGFYRDLDRATLNGDEADLAVCDVDVLPLGAPVNTLCTGGVDERATSAPLVDVVSGRFISQDEAEGDGALNRSLTRSKGYGASVQATAVSRIGDRENTFVVGASVDLADVDFASNGEVGALTVDREVTGSGLFAGIHGIAPDDIFNTELKTENRALGLYFSNTLSLTDRAHLTVSGRFNDASLTIHDQIGTSLDGDHSFSRFNPAAGVVYEIDERLSIFGRYSESNRAPTAAELSCADPSEPCRLPNAFVSDPPLEQAVARSVEGGIRGGTRPGGSRRLDWSLATYWSGIRDDILFVASPVLIGTGFFGNAGDTRRVGLDLEVTGGGDPLRWYLSYGVVKATFESPLVLPSNEEVNDAANENGEISVQPGDRLPGIPTHSLKVGWQYDLTEAWDIALEGVFASSRIFLGDEGNDQEPLEGYEVANLRSSYAFSDQVRLIGRVDNLFNADYATFGVLAQVELELEEAPGASVPRFVSPGAPRSAFVGLRVLF